ncbi:hypothetical protein ACP9LN_004732, partial [Escherichia coli]
GLRAVFSALSLCFFEVIPHFAGAPVSKERNAAKRARHAYKTTAQRAKEPADIALAFRQCGVDLV